MNIVERPLTSRGFQRVQIDVPEGSRVDVLSPNWCDRTTWYYSSTKVAMETLTDSGDNLTFNSAHVNWIDVSHGKLTQEHRISQYKPIVRVGGLAKIESSPDTQDGDYQIDYTTGKVTFNTAQTAQVTADYYYESGSSWSIAPSSGKILRITAVEVQFDANVILTDTVQFQAYVMGGPYGSPTRYQTMMDYINEASLAYPSIPPMGGTGWRGTHVPIQIFQWPYAQRSSTDLKSSLQMEIKISLENDTEIQGNYAIATFYGKSEDE